MRSDDAGQMSGHACTSDEDLHPPPLGRGDVLRRLLRGSMGGQDAHVARNVEVVQDITRFQDHRQVARAAGQDCHDGLVSLRELTFRQDRSGGDLLLAKCRGSATPWHLKKPLRILKPRL